jgi:hypothetical protein
VIPACSPLPEDQTRRRFRLGDLLRWQAVRFPIVGMERELNSVREDLFCWTYSGGARWWQILPSWRSSSVAGREVSCHRDGQGVEFGT